MKKQHILIRIIKFFLKGGLAVFELFLGFILVLILIIILVSKISPPAITEIEVGERVMVAKDHYIIGENWLKKNEFGVWEMYIEGAPYERGLIYGKLAKELVQKQETIFVGQINNFVPSQTWQQFLRLMIGFFNKDLPSSMSLENQQEIYGVSQSFSDEYNYIASKYSRILNYHAAHDIGHALNDYSMVGCTSFAIKDDKTADSSLIIGRNFDFFVGEDFAKEKLVLFIKPDKGYPFVSYSWAGFTGVVSGLNDQGLSVTINASKSDLPTGSKTPISILAREILQYASTIEEAIAIAKTRDTFVSETILVSSKKDGKAALIEKSPSKMGIFAPETNALICSNHYQSDVFLKDKINIDNIEESDSKFRYNRVKDLLNGKDSLTIFDAAKILRNQKGEHGDTLGMGNPRAINQLIAHHSVIIQPEALKFYVTTHDFQLGTFKGYDLNEVFGNKSSDSQLRIAADPFVNSSAYESFKKYKTTKNKISEFITFNKPLKLSDSEVNEFIATNGELYITYEMLGRYFMKVGNKKKAKYYFEIALTKTLASKQIEEEFKELIKECN